VLKVAEPFHNSFHAKTVPAMRHRAVPSCIQVKPILFRVFSLVF